MKLSLINGCGICKIMFLVSLSFEVALLTNIIIATKKVNKQIYGTTSHSTSTLTNFVFTIICVHVIDAQDSQYHLTFPRYDCCI